jgi:hypothetical protein
MWNGQVMLLMIEEAILTLVKMQWRIWADVYAPLISSIYHYRVRCATLRNAVQRQKCISFWRWLRIMQWQLYKLQMLIKYGIPEIK